MGLVSGWLYLDQTANWFPADMFEQNTEPHGFDGLQMQKIERKYSERYFQSYRRAHKTKTIKKQVKE